MTPTSAPSSASLIAPARTSPIAAVPPAPPTTEQLVIASLQAATNLAAMFFPEAAAFTPLADAVEALSVELVGIALKPKTATDVYSDPATEAMLAAAIKEHS